MRIKEILEGTEPDVTASVEDVEGMDDTGGESMPPMGGAPEPDLGGGQPPQAMAPQPEPVDFDDKAYAPNANHEFVKNFDHAAAEENPVSIASMSTEALDDLIDKTNMRLINITNKSESGLYGDTTFKYLTALVSYATAIKNEK